MKRNNLHFRDLLAGLLLGCLLLLGQPALWAQSATGWTGANDGFWNNALNWTNGIPNSGSPAARILNFGPAGNARANSTNDMNNVSTHRIFFNNGATNYTLYLKAGTGGTTLNDFGGNIPKIQNDSTNLQTIDMAFKLQGKGNATANQAGEINPVNADIVFTTNALVTLITNTQLRFYGIRTVTFYGGIVNSLGVTNSCALMTGPTIVFASTNGCTNTFINSGTVRLVVPDITTAPITLGDPTVAASTTATLQMDNGLTNNSSLVVLFGSAGARTIANTTNGSGPAVYGGPLSLGTNLTTVANAGSQLIFTGDVNFQNPAGTGPRTITVAGDGDTVFSGSFTNATTGSSVLAKTNAGTLSLSGSNALRVLYNHNGGVISISSSNQIGVPTGANYPDKFNFNENATLRVTNSFTLGRNASGVDNAGFRITGGKTGTFEVLADSTFTLDGVIMDKPATGSGSLSKTGAGTLVLTQPNTYSGNTLVSGGLLALTGAGALTTSPLITVASAATLSGNGSIAGTVAVSGTIAAGTSVGQLNTGPEVWNGSATNIVEVIDATGSAGAGYDSLNINGGIDLQATSGNKFNLKLVSQDGTGTAGSVTNFDNNISYTWNLASTTGSVTNFSADKFNVDTSAFVNDLAGGEFLVESGSLNLRFTNNHAPAAVNLPLLRYSGGELKIKITDLLAGQTSDADGDPRQLIAISGSTNNAALSTNGAYIFYSHTNNAPDSFTYTVRDLRSAYRAGDTVRTATATVLIDVLPAIGSNAVVSLAAVGVGTNQLTFAGIPGYDYIIQFATNTDSSPWFNLSTNTAGTNGLWSVIDDSATNEMRFYRSMLK